MKKEIEGIGHFYADPECSHAIIDSKIVSICSLAEGAEIMSYDDGFGICTKSGGRNREEYRSRTGRKVPKAYRIKLSIEFEEVSEEEAIAHWQEEAYEDRDVTKE